MTFTIRQLFVGILTFGPAMGIAWNSGPLGIRLAIAYTCLTLAVFFAISRLIRSWKHETLMRRCYGIMLATLLFGFWGILVSNIVANPTIHRTRMAARLQATLSTDERFKAVHIAYIERKPKYLDVTGFVQTEGDYKDLQEVIMNRNWANMDGIYWRLRIKSTNRWLDEPDWHNARL